MIAGAALLVLLGLGLFVAGILTGVTALYWACVAACLVAAVLLIAARRQIGTMPTDGKPAVTGGKPAAATPEPVESGAAAASTEPASARAEPTATPTATPAAGAPADPPDPEVEDVEVTDLLIVVDLKDEVLVVDEHPRYHLAGCSWLAGRETIPLPLDEARTDGFTPCAVCAPDRNLAERARARRHAGG